MHILYTYEHLRTLTLIYTCTCKRANKVNFFNNFVTTLQSAKNGLKPVPRQHCK